MIIRQYMRSTYSKIFNFYHRFVKQYVKMSFMLKYAI